MSFRVWISMNPCASAITKCSTSAQFKSNYISTVPKSIRFCSFKENYLPKSLFKRKVHPFKLLDCENIFLFEESLNWINDFDFS